MKSLISGCWKSFRVQAQRSWTGNSSEPALKTIQRIFRDCAIITWREGWEMGKIRLRSTASSPASSPHWFPHT